MQIKEFKQQAKNLMLENGLRKSDISITSDNWLKIRVICDNKDLYSKLHNQIEHLAGFKNDSNIMEDYFDYKVNIKRDNGGNYGGLLITRAQ